LTADPLRRQNRFACDETVASVYSGCKESTIPNGFRLGSIGNENEKKGRLLLHSKEK
jgi:hypothetical protein